MAVRRGNGYIADKEREIKTKATLKEAIKQPNADFQRQARNEKERYFKEACVEIESDNRAGKNEIFFFLRSEITGMFRSGVPNLWYTYHRWYIWTFSVEKCRM